MLLFWITYRKWFYFDFGQPRLGKCLEILQTEHRYQYSAAELMDIHRLKDFPQVLEMKTVKLRCNQWDQCRAVLL